MSCPCHVPVTGVSHRHTATRQTSAQCCVHINTHASLHLCVSIHVSLLSLFMYITSHHMCDMSRIQSVSNTTLPLCLSPQQLWSGEPVCYVDLHTTSAPPTLSLPLTWTLESTQHNSLVAQQTQTTKHAQVTTD